MIFFHSCSNCNKGFAHKLQLQKHHCEAKTSEVAEPVKIVKVKFVNFREQNLLILFQIKIQTTQQTVKKPKIMKEERKEINVIQQTQLPPKLVLQAPAQTQQLSAINKNENQTQQIFLSLTQQHAKPGTFYTIPSNFILNSNGTFMTAAAGSELGNLKFETQ